MTSIPLIQPCKIKLIKTTYTFDDGQIVSGVVCQLAPMIQKFIAISDSKFEALGYMNPDFAQWFANAPEGASTTFVENE